MCVYGASLAAFATTIIWRATLAIGENVCWVTLWAPTVAAFQLFVSSTIMSTGRESRSTSLRCVGKTPQFYLSLIDVSINSSVAWTSKKTHTMRLCVMFSFVDVTRSLSLALLAIS